MERKKLGSAELEEKLQNLDGWKTDGSSISRRFEFANFAEAIEFVNRVGAIAEERDHHPDITFGWGYAEILLTTHDRGGVTDVDIALAGQINGL
jgi:4a-hydroxytetrahydrobiopterin dehydratase